MKTGLIFDMDGTLWDSTVNVAKSWNMTAMQCGYERAEITKEEMMSVMGKTMDVIADILFADLEKDARMEILEKCCHVENNYLKENGGVLYPRLEETLKILKEKYHLYIVSNCQSGYIEAFLEHYGFGYLFEDIECFGNNNLPKGDNIALVVKRNNLDMAYYVGDIQGDYDATMKAVEILGVKDISNDISSEQKGLGFIHAKYGFGKIDASVLELEAFEKLPELIG